MLDQIPLDIGQNSYFIGDSHRLRFIILLVPLFIRIVLDVKIGSNGIVWQIAKGLVKVVGIVGRPS